MKFSPIYLTFLIGLTFLSLNGEEKKDKHEKDKPFVSAKITDQLGNNMFQVAAASALAWDNGAIGIFPDFWNYPKIFSRCNRKALPCEPSVHWYEPSFAYHPIPYSPNMQIHGYFQSEKYFAHHRKKILKLFRPVDSDSSYIKKKYGRLLKSDKTVGIQLRWYFEDTWGNFHIQYGKDYLDRTTSLFPADSVFIVSTNNLEFARQQMPQNLNKVVYIEKEPNHIDLFILSKCKDIIITNSTFGWWAAWLNTNPDKKIIAPKDWFHPNSGMPTQDLLPESWIKIEAKFGGSNGHGLCAD